IVSFDLVPTTVEKEVRDILHKIPNDLIKVQSEFLGMTVTANDSFPGCKLQVIFKMELLKDYFNKTASL
ncbi:hypothetical protein EUY20_21210, partial [Salmonella enterica]|nr:hypothetical protein [Salmonella enterica]